MSMERKRMFDDSKVKVSIYQKRIYLEIFLKIIDNLVNEQINKFSLLNRNKLHRMEVKNLKTKIVS